MIFAEYITTLATALTIFNVYSSSSVSASSGLSGVSGGLSFRSARRWRRRTITSSARIYVTMAVPYVAATVLVNNIAAEEVVPIYIAAVASVSGRFNKGRHTVLEWSFKTARTMAILWTIFFFMLFQGIDREKRAAINALYNVVIEPRHVLLCLVTSWRWAIIALVGLVTAPLEHRKTNVALAAVKIALVWLLLERSGTAAAAGAWGIFDRVIVTNTPLRNTVYVLYSFLIVTDAMESVAASFAATKALGSPARHSNSSTDDEDDHNYDSLSVLRNPEPMETLTLTFDEFWTYCGESMWHFVAALVPQAVFGGTEPADDRVQKDKDSDATPDTDPDLEAGVPPGDAEVHVDAGPPLPPLPGGVNVRPD